MSDELKPRTRRAADRYTERCAALSKSGRPCKAYALRDGSGFCRLHSLTPAERKRNSIEALAAKAEREQLRELARDAAVELPSGYLDELPQPELTETQEVLLERLRAERQAREDTAIEAMIDASDDWVGVARIATPRQRE